MRKPTIKTKKELEIMSEGGKMLGKVKKELKNAVKIDVSAGEIEELATKLILDQSAKPSFKLVPGYSWTTCINVNEGVVHGIPHKEIIFKKGDLVSVDVGLFYKGFHTDTSFTILLGNENEKEKFLEVGRSALKKGIKEAKPGKTVGDISSIIEKTLIKNNAQPIKSLTGHGIGRDLHEAPLIPCFVSNTPDEKVELKEGMTLAIEVMYTKGSHHVKVGQDGWTISTKDGKISALFEETVAVTNSKPKVLTSDQA